MSITPDTKVFLGSKLGDLDHAGDPQLRVERSASRGRSEFSVFREGCDQGSRCEFWALGVLPAPAARGSCTKAQEPTKGCSCKNRQDTGL